MVSQSFLKNKKSYTDIKEPVGGMLQGDVNKVTTLAARELKRSRIGIDSYLDTRFILPTSILCERLLSRAGYDLGDHLQ